MTIEQLKKICPLGKNLDQWIKPLNDTMQRYEINTFDRVAAFMAQIAHESGEFRYSEEIASGAAYDTGDIAKSLGNTPEKDGDGEKYKGRGPIQTTGHDNYLAASIEIFGDDRLLKNPELLLIPEYGMMASGFFWKRKNLNKIADNPKVFYTFGKRNPIRITAFEYIGTRVNGGLNGREDRNKYYARALAALK